MKQQSLGARNKLHHKTESTEKGWKPLKLTANKLKFMHSSFSKWKREISLRKTTDSNFITKAVLLKHEQYYKI